MVALSASRLVCSAMVLMSSTTSPMRPAAFDNSPTRSLVLRAWPTASVAIRADCCIWRPISEIDEDSSSVADATDCTLVEASSEAAATEEGEHIDPSSETMTTMAMIRLIRLACAVAATTSSLEATEFFCALSTVVSIRCGPGDGRRKTAPRARAAKIRIARSPAPPGSRAQRWPSAGLSDDGDMAWQSSHQLERVGKKLRPAEIARFEC